ncbi:MAG: hypothetical protein HRU28_04120 [Rhizobiales bacterium]|nr:hypothetical protein [Hyphomicrobiales bacterium]
MDKKIKSELKKNAKKQMKKLIKTKTGINLNRQVTPVRLAVRLSNSITRKVKKYLKQVDARTQKQLHDVILKINRLGRRPTSIEKMNGRSSFAVARSKMNMTEKNYVKFKSCDLKKIDKKIHDFFLDTYFIIGAEKYGDIGVSYAQTIYAKVGYILYKSAANNCGVQVANKLNIYSSRYNKFIRRYKLLVNIKIRWAL